MTKPNKEEYAPYYSTYIDLVPEGDIFEILNKQIDEVKNILSIIDEPNSLFRYAENKWSVREVIGHILDGERIFAYRVLRFSRNDKTELEGFNQNDYVPNSNHNNIPLSQLIEEFESIRHSNILLFKTFSDEMWSRIGVANKNKISVKAAIYVMIGHCSHHLNVIKEKYL